MTIPSIATSVPCEAVQRENIAIPANIKLADPTFYKPARVDVLLGAGPTLSSFCIGQMHLLNKNTDLYLQKTRLGWIIGGHVGIKGTAEEVSCKLTELKYDLDKFWNVEEGPPLAHHSQEEIDCEKHFVTNVTRQATGRYIVALPFKNNREALGELRTQAIKRLNLLLKKFEKNPEFKKGYSAVINEYINLGHMSEVHDIVTPGFYLPHHAVVKETSATTKLRVVFDGSAKTSTGLSLNDTLMVGPTIQDDIFSLLLRFRLHHYIVSADIEKMYRQILIRKEGRKYQRILWKEDDQIKTYELNTVTFGLAPAPFLAIRSLDKLADDEEHQFPIAARILKKDLYVDNLLTGADTITEARKIREDITKLLKLGEFNLRQWASNDSRILHGLDNDQIDTNFQLDREQTLKTLGLSWNTKNDSITYTVNYDTTPTANSKRAILSDIAKIFDP